MNHRWKDNTCILWQQKRKYVRFTKEIDHYQIDKWNGTKGCVKIHPDNFGVLNEKNGTYIFKQVGSIVPEFIKELLDMVEERGITQFYDSIHSGKVYDEDHKKHIERFDLRILKAKTKIDLDIAWIYFCAAEENRLSIKLTLMEKTITNEP